ncbi:ester cyclase [Plebeiibacterium sediminum]|uniref:Ester cyclase n=1 Tax=Plebeiibacterium sediminum TaxID=2992112 RepID=A0AAE3SH91_9BACT|nr:ester cyclase [Plebeiobacterium sediminum]MCW3789136.1 ester cyclase [Plebeiobacterium sediminum]
MKTKWILSKMTIVLMAAMVFVSCEDDLSDKKEQEYQTEIEELKAELAKFALANETVAQYLETFDELDYEIFTNQEWTRFHESHTDDIIVHWPDGRETVGLDAHIADLEAMFVYAPDTRIKEHPIAIGSGNITAVMGVMEGTFTEPMPLGNGQFIEPTGNAFKINMVTIGLWNEDGIMYEEYLFWDNQTFMSQLGLL